MSAPTPSITTISSGRQSWLASPQLAAGAFALLLVGLLCGPAVAQTAPVLTLSPALTSTLPYFAPVEGGTVVTINGNNLNLDSNVTFTFGGVPAAIQSLAARSATVIVPPHAAGQVDVVATFTDGRLGGLWQMFLYGAPPSIGHTGAVEQVSIGTAGNQATVFTANNIGNVLGGTLSPDGGLALFSSDARDLVTGAPLASATTLMLRDRATGVTTALPPVGPENYSARLSTDGRFVAFQTAGGGPSQVYLHDRLAATIVRLSSSAAGTPGSANSTAATISGDGQFVAYLSSATNLVDGDTNGFTDMFLRDTLAGTTINVTAGGNGAARSAAVTRDGRFVVFASSASNLVAGDTNARSDLFVYDLAAGGITRIGMAPGGAEPDGDASVLVVTPDGRFVAFVSGAANLVTGDTNHITDTFLLDRTTGSIARVSVATDGTEANAPSTPQGISANGRRISFTAGLFTTLAPNLVPMDLNGAQDLFVHDTLTGETLLVGTGPDGVFLPRGATGGAMSDDGSIVMFASADGLVAADTNGRSDVYIKHLGNTPLGSHVAVTPIDGATGGTPVTLTFASVTAPGETSVVSSQAGPGGPTGFQLVGVYYDISTSAAFTPPAQVCIAYSLPLPAGMIESELAIFHYDGSAWAALGGRTQDLDAHVLCGDTTSFSPFAVFGVPDTTPPVITISAPAPGATLVAGASATAAYTCADERSTVTSCSAVDEGGAAIANGGALNTAIAGTHSLMVTANDAAGNVTSSTVTYTVTEPHTALPGSMTGGGVVAEGGTPATFEFAVRESDRGERGHVRAAWRPTAGHEPGDACDHDRGRRGHRAGDRCEHEREASRVSRFESTSITSVSFTDDPAITPGRHRGPDVDTVTFTGTGRWNGEAGFTFDVISTDRGEPGRGRDTFAITVRNAAGAVVGSASGMLEAGNVQSARLRGRGGHSGER